MYNDYNDNSNTEDNGISLDKNIVSERNITDGYDYGNEYSENVDSDTGYSYGSEYSSFDFDSYNKFSGGFGEANPDFYLEYDDDEYYNSEEYKNVKDMSTAGMILGICSIGVKCVPCLGSLSWIACVLGLIFSIIGLKKGGEKGPCISGIICSSVTIVINLGGILFYVLYYVFELVEIFN